MCAYLGMGLAELFAVLIESVGAIEVARFRASFEDPFDEPLNDREYVNEITALNLIRFNGMRAFHTRQNENDTFGQCSKGDGERRSRRCLHTGYLHLLTKTGILFVEHVDIDGEVARLNTPRQSTDDLHATMEAVDRQRSALLFRSRTSL